ncbi:MAG TPA: TetR family transcriptional regulator [Coriobacteriia bacterium]|nr:TetR family transcriptional regulator [Coriobacteriia bacterium]
MTPREQPLTRDEILAAALVIVDDGGPDALSMRKLASALGVEAMTLYHHFTNKDAILDGVVECVFAGMHMPEPLPKEWMALAEEMFVAFRRVLVEHPATIALLARRPLNTEISADFVEAPLAVLARSGLPPERVGQLYQSLVAYAFGHAFIGSDRPTAPAESSLRTDTARYPTAMAAGAAVAQFDEATFRETLGHIMRGFVGKA